MCASTSRPLVIDERLSFDLALSDGENLAGEARVLREQSFGTYALRFERVSSEARARLLDIAGSGDAVEMTSGGRLPVRCSTS